jgi:hypothetical protein
MARMKRAANKAAPVLFNIVYEDGSLSSNRKVPSDVLDGIDDDAAARAFIEAQDRDIAAKSGRPRGRVKTITKLKQR